MAKRTDSDKRMAAALRDNGIYHGRRMTTTTAPPVPPIGSVGSAAYRRLMAKKAK